MTTIYHYHPVTGEYLGADTARLDPLDKQPLIPAHATTEAPPEVGQGEAAAFRDGAWVVLEDHRGETVYSTATGEPFTIEELGPIPEGYAAEPPPPSLEDAKARRRAEVQLRLAHAFNAGMPYGGKVLQLRPGDQVNITAMSQKAELAKAGLVAWPADFRWRMADNSFLPLPTPDDGIAMADAAATEVVRLYEVSWAHKDAIEAMVSVEDVLAYDISIGW